MAIKIQEENLRKAHREGCSDVKKVLETIAPEVFEHKFPKIMKGSSGALVLFVSEKSGYVINDKGYRNQHEFRTDWIIDSFIPIKGIREVE